MPRRRLVNRTRYTLERAQEAFEAHGLTVYALFKLYLTLVGESQRVQLCVIRSGKFSREDSREFTHCYPFSNRPYRRHLEVGVIPSLPHESSTSRII